MELFASELAAKRWTLWNYKTGHRMFRPLVDSVPQQSSVSVTPRRRHLIANGKYKRALLLGQKLASLASECGHDYEQRLCVLENLTKMWEAGKQAAVVEVVVQDPPPADTPSDQDLSMTGRAAQNVLSDLQSD